MTSAIPVQCSSNWAFKPTGSWSFCGFVIYPWRMNKWIWIYETYLFHVFIFSSLHMIAIYPGIVNPLRSFHHCEFAIPDRVTYLKVSRVIKRLPSPPPPPPLLASLNIPQAAMCTLLDPFKVPRVRTPGPPKEWPPHIRPLKVAATPSDSLPKIKTPLIRTTKQPQLNFIMILWRTTLFLVTVRNSCKEGLSW